MFYSSAKLAEALALAHTKHSQPEYAQWARTQTEYNLNPNKVMIFLAININARCGVAAA